MQLMAAALKVFLRRETGRKCTDQLQQGDYVFIQFGHNDAKKEDTLRYAAPRPDYKENLKRIIQETREKIGNSDSINTDYAEKFR